MTTQPDHNSMMTPDGAFAAILAKRLAVSPFTAMLAGRPNQARAREWYGYCMKNRADGMQADGALFDANALEAVLDVSTVVSHMPAPLQFTDEDLVTVLGLKAGCDCATCRRGRGGASGEIVLEAGTRLGIMAAEAEAVAIVCEDMLRLERVCVVWGIPGYPNAERTGGIETTKECGVPTTGVRPLVCFFGILTPSGPMILDVHTRLYQGAGLPGGIPDGGMPAYVKTPGEPGAGGLPGYGLDAYFSAMWYRTQIAPQVTAHARTIAKVVGLSSEAYRQCAAERKGSHTD